MLYVKVVKRVLKEGGKKTNNPTKNKDLNRCLSKNIQMVKSKRKDAHHQGMFNIMQAFSENRDSQKIDHLENAN